MTMKCNIIYGELVHLGETSNKTIALIYISISLQINDIRL